MEQKPFLAALFDTTFTEFITIRWIKVIFIVFLVFAAIPLLGGCLFSLVLIKAGGFMGFIEALFLLAALGVVFLIDVIVARLFLELVVVLFRIEEHTKKLALPVVTA